MRTETVEIYSDATNAAVMRHPARQFPGVLIQGDTLFTLVRQIESIRSLTNPQDAAEELADLYEHMNELLEHYKTVLRTHSIGLPFHDQNNS
jgi:hypothetical protein